MAEGFIEKTKGFFGFGAIDSYDDRAYGRDDFDDYPENEDLRDDVRPEPRYASPSGRHADRAPYSDRLDDRPVTERAGGAGRLPGGRSVPPVAERREAELVVVDVREYRDVSKVTPEYRRGNIVGFHLGALDKAEGLQFLAFIGGLAAALDGRVEKIGGLRNFALVPDGARLGIDQRDTLESRLTGER